MLNPILVVPDTHAPFHDQRAWKLMMQTARAVRPKMIIHLGDLFDFYAVSSHSKNPRRATELKYEIREGRRLLKQLADLAPTQLILGNHEDRLQRYVEGRAPELYEIVTAKSLMGLGKLGVRSTPYRQSFRLGHMRFTHDVNGMAGKHAIVNSLGAMGHNVCIGHIHRIGYHVNGDLEGDRHVGIGLGWLGDLSAIDYMHRDTITKDWALGFGIGYHDTENDYTQITPVPIMPDYTCIVNGRRFSQGKEV